MDSCGNVYVMDNCFGSVPFLDDCTWFSAKISMLCSNEGYWRVASDV